MQRVGSKCAIVSRSIHDPTDGRHLNNLPGAAYLSGDDFPPRMDRPGVAAQRPGLTLEDFTLVISSVTAVVAAGISDISDTGTTASAITPPFTASN